MKLLELRVLVDEAIIKFGSHHEMGYFNAAGDFTEMDADIYKENVEGTLIFNEAE